MLHMQMISCLFVRRVNYRKNAFIKYVSCIVYRSFVRFVYHSFVSFVYSSFVFRFVRPSN
jgi:hypothetical protein